MNRRRRRDKLHAVPRFQELRMLVYALLPWWCLSHTVRPISSPFASQSTEIKIVPYRAQNCSFKATSSTTSRLDSLVSYDDIQGQIHHSMQQLYCWGKWSGFLVPLTQAPCLKRVVLCRIIVTVHLFLHWLLYRTEGRIPLEAESECHLTGQVNYSIPYYAQLGRTLFQNHHLLSAKVWWRVTRY